MKKKIVIAGGGISGLTCGLHLSERGHKVIVLEKENIVGGLARSIYVDNKWIPLTYRHIMMPDKVSRHYINRFGFKSNLQWVTSSQIFWYNYKPFLLSRPHHIFSFDALSIKDKLRLLRFGLYVWGKKNWDNLKGANCEKWLKKTAGEKNTEILFRNLMEIKFGMRLADISAAWLGRRLHQSARNYDYFGTLTCGWQPLLNSISDRIEKMGGQIITDFEVTSIGKGCVQGKTKNGDIISFKTDIIVTTLPPPIAMTLLKEADTENIKKMGWVNYKAMISLVATIPNTMPCHYWNVVLSPHLIFGGFFNYTLVAPTAKVCGRNIYYFFRYIDEADPHIRSFENNKIREMFLSDLRKLIPACSFEWHSISRIKYSMPIFKQNYDNLPIELEPYIYLSGVYRQYPKPRTMDSAFCSGRETAKYILDKYEKH